MIFPRDYQEECVDATFAKLQQYQSTLVVSATGTGKTVEFAWLARCWPAASGRVMILVNQEELAWQALAVCQEICPNDRIEIEMATARASHDPGLWGDVPRIVIASKDSLWRWHRLRRYGRDEIGLMVIDEGHHAVRTNKTYGRILDYFRSAKRVGVTATPDRYDGKALGQTYESVAYCYDILQAVTDGWLVPIQQKVITVAGLSVAGLKTARKKLGGIDFDAAHLDRAMRQEGPLWGVCGPAWDLSNYGGQRRPTLIFACSVDHAHLMAALLNRLAVARHAAGEWPSPEPVAAALDGDTDKDDRRATLARFKEGRLQYLCGCNLFTEGFDAPEVRVVVIARPTLSRALYAQMIGRGTRPAAELVPTLNATKDPAARKALIAASRKPSLLVVDCVGVADLHKLSVGSRRQVTSLDILGGIYPDEVRLKALLALADSPSGRGDTVKTLKRAKARLDAVEMDRRRELILKAEYEMRAVDPFDLLNIRPRREPRMLRGKLATPRQVAYLERLGVPVAADLSFWDAKTLITEHQARRDAGPASEAQALLLSRFGVNPEGLTWAAAHAAIEEIQKAGWKRPIPVQIGE